MPGSKKILTEREAILKAMATPPPGGYFVWDGVDEDDRPLTEEEMRAGMEADLQDGAVVRQALHPRFRLRFVLIVRLWKVSAPPARAGKRA